MKHVSETVGERSSPSWEAAAGAIGSRLAAILSNPAALAGAASCAQLG